MLPEPLERILALGGVAELTPPVRAMQAEHELRELPDTFTTFHPAVRIVLDFASMRSAVSTQLMEIRQRDLWTMQVVQSGPRVRVIIQLLRPMIKEIRTAGNELLITLQRP